MEIKEIKKLREQLGYRQIIIIGLDDDGYEHVSTHGRTKKDAKECCDIANLIKEKALLWDKDHCNATPLERICQNCEFWKVAKDITGLGVCALSDISMKKWDFECGNFEPR